MINLGCFIFQVNLQSALLNLGQFQMAIDELLSWLGRTRHSLDEAEPVYGDPRMVKLELAKLKVSDGQINLYLSKGIYNINFLHIKDTLSWLHLFCRTG